MAEIFALAICALVIVLYLQSRAMARHIRRNRLNAPKASPDITGILATKSRQG